MRVVLLLVVLLASCALEVDTHVRVAVTRVCPCGCGVCHGAAICRTR